MVVLSGIALPHTAWYRTTPHRPTPHRTGLHRTSPHRTAYDVSPRWMLCQGSNAHRRDQGSSPDCIRLYIQLCTLDSVHTVTCHVRPEESIAALLFTSCDAFGVGVHRSWLSTVGGKPLDSWRTITDYNLQSGASLFLSLRLLGTLAAP